ncbi:MAG TPA: hypothetical protein VGO79_06935 [Thermoanaerobaculia bacterium]
MSPAPLRAVAALGGALGALPLIPIVRTLAMRVSGPPRLMGRELADYDFKSATYAEAAVFLLVVPLAALFFGRWLPRVGAGTLPGIVFALSLVGWRLGLRPKLALGMGLLLATAAVILAVRRRRGEPREAAPRQSAIENAGNRGWLTRTAPAVVFVVIAVCAWRLYRHTRGHLEYFEDGHMLANAQTYLGGGRPYVDTYPVHGWGSDGGLDAIVFRFAAPTLLVYWSTRTALSALSVAALAAACWALFRPRWLWVVAAFVLALALCPFLSERQLPAFLTLAALLGAARSRRGALWFLAGAFGSLTLFFALDFGVFVLTGSVLAASALGLLERRPREALRSLFLFATGALAAALPFLALLASEHAIAAFVRVSFDQLPRSIEDVWGLPAGTTVALLRDGSARELVAALLSQNPARPLRWLAPVLLLGAAVSVLLFRATSSTARRLDSLDRGALGATAVAVVSARGILGRVDAGHLALYGVLAALPIVWLVYRAAHAEHRVAGVALALVLALALWVRFDPRWMLKTWWLGIRGPGLEAASDETCWRSPVRGGGALVSCAEADEIAAFRRHVDAHLRPDETFFDFSNQAALYFYTDRRNPIRYVAAPFYEPEAFQHEVIAALERERPPMVVLPHGEWTDNFDGIANRLRTPLVADYVYANYRVVEVVGGRFIGWRPPDLPAQMPARDSPPTPAARSSP